MNKQYLMYGLLFQIVVLQAMEIKIERNESLTPEFNPLSPKNETQKVVYPLSPKQEKIDDVVQQAAYILGIENSPVCQDITNDQIVSSKIVISKTNKLDNKKPQMAHKNVVGGVVCGGLIIGITFVGLHFSHII